MSEDSISNLEFDMGDARVTCVSGVQIHEKAINMLWARTCEMHGAAKREERFLSRYEMASDVNIAYPRQGELVLDYLAAGEGDVVYVWDLWPAENELPELLGVLDQLDPRAPDLATRYSARPVPGPPIRRPMTLYFPRGLNGLGGYWLSIFNAEDWRSHFPPGATAPAPRHEPGFVYYQEYYEVSEPPFLVDALLPASIEVPAPGIHPDPDTETSMRGSLFPAPIRVSGPGILPDQLEPSRVSCLRRRDGCP